MMLHNHFADLVTAAVLPVKGEDNDPWDIINFPVIQAAQDHPVPTSDTVVSDDGADADFDGIAEPHKDGAVLRRSTRIAGDVSSGVV